MVGCVPPAHAPNQAIGAPHGPQGKPPALERPPTQHGAQGLLHCGESHAACKVFSDWLLYHLLEPAQAWQPITPPGSPRGISPQGGRAAGNGDRTTPRAARAQATLALLVQRQRLCGTCCPEQGQAARPGWAPGSAGRGGGAEVVGEGPGRAEGWDGAKQNPGGGLGCLRLPSPAPLLLENRGPSPALSSPPHHGRCFSSRWESGGVTAAGFLVRSCQVGLLQPPSATISS